MTEELTPRRRVLHRSGGRTLVQKHMAAETDVNQIVNRYTTKGVLPLANNRVATYGDFTDVGTYHDAMNRITRIERDFAALPAHIRHACRNDPAELVDLVTNPARTEQAIELGLLERPKPAPVPDQPAPIADAPAAPESLKHQNQDF